MNTTFLFSIDDKIVLFKHKIKKLCRRFLHAYKKFECELIPIFVYGNHTLDVFNKNQLHSKQ